MQVIFTHFFFCYRNDERLWWAAIQSSIEEIAKRCWRSWFSLLFVNLHSRRNKRKGTGRETCPKGRHVSDQLTTNLLLLFIFFIIFFFVIFIIIIIIFFFFFFFFFCSWERQSIRNVWRTFREAFVASIKIERCSEFRLQICNNRSSTPIISYNATVLLTHLHKFA